MSTSILCREQLTIDVENRDSSLATFNLQGLTNGNVRYLTCYGKCHFFIVS
ncbi:hypothetical protein DER72_101283 [Halomonas sp. A11-A]|nr:hypothetical protein DER72_101283 [Halomonas sp. A11-A]